MTHAPTRAALASVAAPRLRPLDGPPGPVPPQRPRGSSGRRITEGELVDDELRVSLDERTVSVGSCILELTFLEFELLAHLLLHPRQVFSRRQLMETVWGYPEAGGGRTVDVHIARLRRKLGARHRDRLATVRRVGYKYVPHDMTVLPSRIPQPRTRVQTPVG
ncbi:winged helix-turn-helix domain-containing protein [Yinghuangia sp. YIM S09857]|uniref:winged helix-turn-helix domain-containing protein n=1 Tax=Yinghuangia sp. YIM S09857 TaxID=3436929 RepID=UPI003F52A852